MPQSPRDDPPNYRVYNSRPKGFLSKLRGENDREIESRAQERATQRPPRSRQPSGSNRPAGARGQQPPDFGLDQLDARGRGSGGRGPRRPGRGGRVPSVPHGRLAWLRRPLFGLSLFTPLRIIKTVVGFVIFWVALSLVLFVISAHESAGNLPAGAKSALTGGSPMLFSADTVLILGLDNRPTSGYSSHEAGANYSEADANTDSIMLWRVGGGVSRKLSIPRDTLVDLPDACGYQKINAAWSCGGPQLTIEMVEKLTGVKVNHLIVVDLGNFIKFIDDIGGVTVKTPRICSAISGGAADGGYTLNLAPGVHHLTGTQAVTLARTRDNSCNIAYTDLNREAMQQQIVNSIQSQLLTAHTFFHLPWASWDAPKAIQTDMGAADLAQLFIASEIGGSAQPELLKESGSTYNGEDVLIPNQANVQQQVNRLMTGS